MFKPIFLAEFSISTPNIFAYLFVDLEKYVACCIYIEGKIKTHPFTIIQSTYKIKNLYKNLFFYIKLSKAITLFLSNSMCLNKHYLSVLINENYIFHLNFYYTLYNFTICFLWLKKIYYKLKQNTHCY